MSLSLCRGRCPDRICHDVLDFPQAERKWVCKVCSCVVSSRKHISTLVYKYGTHFTTPHHVCGEHGYLDSHICRLGHHHGACHSSLKHNFKPDKNTVGACLSGSVVLCGVCYSTELDLLQHAPRQLECSNVHSGREDDA